MWNWLRSISPGSEVEPEKQRTEPGAETICPGGIGLARNRLLSLDEPKKSIEEDRLGYADFARSIARAIGGVYDGSLVIGVHGPWGSGKSTAVNMVVQALTERECRLASVQQTTVVRFNPWWFSEQPQDLASTFFTELSSSLGPAVSPGARAALRRIARKMSGAADFLEFVIGLTPAAMLSKPVASALASGGELISEALSLQEIRNRLIAALRNEQRRILVVIDDIDRLPADEIRKIFRLVKSVADLPYVTYLLVFDRSIASRALEKSAEEDGPEWLEKIIQVSFDLPPIERGNLHRLMFSNLDMILDGFPLGDRVRWGNVFFEAVDPWIQTPRDVARLTNALAVGWPAIRDDANFPDYVAIETLRLFEPDLYHVIRVHQGELCGNAPQDRFLREQQKLGDLLLAAVAEAKRERVKQALVRLFPRLDAEWNNHFYGGGFFEQWTAEMRVCSPQAFATYFRFGVSPDAVSTREYSEWLDLAGDQDEFRAFVQARAQEPRSGGGTRAMALLEEWIARAEKIPDEQVRVAASAMLFAADTFLTREDQDQQAFVFPVSWKVSFAIEPLLKRLPYEVRRQVMEEAIDRSPSLSMAGFFVLLFSSQHGRHSDKEAKPEDERQLTLEDTIEQEERYARRIRCEAADPLRFFEFTDALRTLFSWVKLEDEATVRAWTNSLFQGDNTLFGLVDAVTYEGHSQTAGDAVQRNEPKVDRHILQGIIDVDRLVAWAEGLDEAALTPEQQRIIQRFKQGLRAERY